MSAYTATLERYAAHLQSTRSANTVRTYLDATKAFLKWMDGERLGLAQIDQGVLDRFVRSLGSRGCSPSTSDTWASGTVAFCRFLVDEGVLTRTLPFRKSPVPRKPEREPEVLTHRQLVDLLRRVQELKEPRRTCIQVAAWTGMRVSEIVSLRLGSCAVVDGVVMFSIVGKGNKARRVPMDPRGNEVLKSYLSRGRSALSTASSSPYLFPHPTNPTRHIESWQIQQDLRDLRQQMGLPNLTPHTLRRTFLTDLHDNEVSPFVIRKIAGHTSLATTQRYIHVSEGQLAEAVKEGGHGGKSKA